MGLIWWGIVLIAIGLILALTGGFGLSNVFVTLGWIMLVVGVILAIVYAVGGGRRHVHP